MSSSSVFGFYSSEQHTFPRGSVSQEPALQVTYTVPEPGTTFAATATAMWLQGGGVMCLRGDAITPLELRVVVASIGLFLRLTFNACYGYAL